MSIAPPTKKIIPAPIPQKSKMLLRRRKPSDTFRCGVFIAGFDLTARDLYFTILVEVFTNHILAENMFHESCRVNRTQDYDLETCK